MISPIDDLAGIADRRRHLRLPATRHSALDLRLQLWVIRVTRHLAEAIYARLPAHAALLLALVERLNAI